MFAQVVFIYFREKFLGGNDIHAIVRGFEPEKQTFFIKTYLNAFAKLKVCSTLLGALSRVLWTHNFLLFVLAFVLALGIQPHLF